MTERKASMGDKVYRGDVVKFIRNNISLGTFMKRTVKTADEACWDLCDKLNYVPAIEEKSEPHWIPVTKDTPKEAGTYMCTCYDAGRRIITLVKWQPRTKTWNLTGSRAYWKVIAWCKRPEPYKGVTE